MRSHDQFPRPRAGGGIGRRDLLRAAAGLGALAGAGGMLAACGGAGATATTKTALASRPAKGGSLKLGLPGGSSADTITPGLGLADIDYSRIFALYDPLVWLDPTSAQIGYLLAESITPDHGSLTRWVIKLRQGVHFHSGKLLTAEDVIFSFRRILQEKLPGKSPLAPIDLAGTRALDSHTVLVQMHKPYGSFVEQLASVSAYLPMVSASYTSSAKPDGTGPFVYQSFTRGQSSVFTRNPNYWLTGLPHVDTLTIIDFPDTVSMADALITGQIHGGGLFSGADMATLASSGAGIRTVPSPSGSITPFTMRVDRPPFNDVNLRQAMRLIVDRPQMIDSALDGFATVASDVFSPYDTDFAKTLRRQADIPQAKFLLKKAGREDFTVTLTTSPVSTGTVAMATVLAEQAKAAGVTIDIRNVPPSVFFGDNYLKWPFSQDFYPYSTYLGQVAYSMLPVSPFNETHTDSAQYNKWYDEANAATSDALRKEILYDMQRFDFDQGGYIIPAFIDGLDAYSSKIGGYSADCRQGDPLSSWDFKQFYFKE